MKLSLGHITVGADNARTVADFYRNVIGLEPVATPGATSVDPNSYKWLKLGNTELHIVERDKSLHQRLGVSIDPMAPHLAIELDSVEDIHAMADRLTKAGVDWMDWSPHGIPGRHQMFMIDPGGNLIEFLLGSKDA
jgi:catechol 2,3-dioxygenase-like lactoylglutathione lyase family enzyme